MPRGCWVSQLGGTAKGTASHYPRRFPSARAAVTDGADHVLRTPGPRTRSRRPGSVPQSATRWWSRATEHKRRSYGLHRRFPGKSTELSRAVVCPLHPRRGK
jgi:hypothetical protein